MPLLWKLCFFCRLCPKMFVVFRNWQSSECAHVTPWPAKCGDFSHRLSLNILHTAFVCANECITATAFREELSKTMCHLRLIHVSSPMMKAFAIVVWPLNSDIYASRPTRSHPRLSSPDVTLSHPWYLIQMHKVFGIGVQPENPVQRKLLWHFYFFCFSLLE